MIASVPLTFDLAPEPDGGAVLYVRGEVDLATAPQLRDRLLDEFRRRPKLVVDLSGAMLFDGAALRALHTLHREATRLGRRPPILRGVRPLLAKAFKATGMSALFEIQPCPPLIGRPAVRRMTSARSGYSGRLRAAAPRTSAEGLPSVA